MPVSGASRFFQRYLSHGLVAFFELRRLVDKISGVRLAHAASGRAEREGERFSHHLKVSALQSEPRTLRASPYPHWFFRKTGRQHQAEAGRPHRFSRAIAADDAREVA
ncbi:unnamed protein product [Closterium sp. NIES-54]